MWYIWTSNILHDDANGILPSLFMPFHSLSYTETLLQCRQVEVMNQKHLTHQSPIITNWKLEIFRFYRKYNPQAMTGGNKWTAMQF